MKHTKILSVFIAIIMSFSILSSFSVFAAETDEKLYTLEDLNNMSADEVYEMYTAYGYYTYHAETVDEYVSKVKDRYYRTQYANQNFFALYGYSANYKNTLYVPNETENKIKYMFGDTIEYSLRREGLVIDPSNNKILDYGWLWVDFPSMDKFDTYWPGGEYDVEITDEDILLNIKITICLNQILKNRYEKHCMDDSSDSDSTEHVVSMCDVNLDETIDLYDVIWVTKHIAQVYEFYDWQKAVADVSGDGIVNVIDAIMLAKHVNNPEENPI